MDSEWVDVLIDAPDRAAVDDAAKRLREQLPNLELGIGSGPEILITAPPPQRYFVTGAARVKGETNANTRAILKDALSELEIRFDDGPVPDELDLVVVFL